MTQLTGPTIRSKKASNIQIFQNLIRKIQNALADFGNKVFIKLNWSSPKDAYWALNKLSCDRLSDIYIQLRSSDFINHDLTQVFDNCADKTSIENQSIIKNFQYSLVLRDWLNINSSMEFRCFVHENVLVGVSQRDCRSFYQTLVDNRADILERVSKFYVANIHGKFFDSSYVFDVCSGKKTIKLMDFNPFGVTTDSLLYSWDEFEDKAILETSDSEGRLSNQLDLRIIESNYGISANQYSMYSQPKESLEAFLRSDNAEGLNETDNLAKLIKKNINIQEKEDNLDNIE